MVKKNLGEVITMFLVAGYLDEDDIIPVLKKGTAKMMGEKEEKIFTQPLQKESEWEKEWSKKKNEILGLFNAGQHHLLTQNGSVNLTASQQREEGKYNCRDAKKAVDRTEEFFLSVLSNQEKEIAEEVEEIQTKLHNGHLEAGYKLTNKLLSILKH